ncbi:MAG TPA: RIP metalloprotease RseP, partial [Burkholderiaceae bacterium]|nr:RIP metalloprotease RseP [Burkholderiaceae bacterium]
ERLLQAPPATIEPDAENPITAVGLALQSPKPLVREVQAGSAAEKAGIKAGDKIIGAANQADLSAADLVALVGQYDNQALTLQIERDGTQLQLTVVPTRSPNAQPDEPARMGVMLAADWPMVTVRHGLIASMQQGVVRTADTVWFSLKMMARMVTGHVSVRNISGPVTIADYAGQTARMGLIAYLGYLALISVSIGVLNLLPIPMLDGGHLMYYLIEIVRGKPLSEHWLAAGQRVGIALLAALMGLAFLNDFNRLFS